MAETESVKHPLPKYLEPKYLTDKDTSCPKCRERMQVYTVIVNGLKYSVRFQAFCEGCGHVTMPMKDMEEMQVLKYHRYVPLDENPKGRALDYLMNFNEPWEMQQPQRRDNHDRNRSY